MMDISEKNFEARIEVPLLRDPKNCGSQDVSALEGSTSTGACLSGGYRRLQDRHCSSDGTFSLLLPFVICASVLFFLLSGEVVS